MGYKQDSDVPPLERELRYFLYDLCVDWGFCIPPHEQDRIATQHHISALKFAHDVVEAEGLDPVGNRRFVRRIHDWFVNRFEAHEVSAETFEDRSLKKAKIEW